MTTQRAGLPKSLTVDEFLSWAGDRPGRYELIHGEVTAMAPERAIHARMKLKIVSQLAAAIRAASLSCEAMTDGMTVKTSDDTAFEPDALVYCGPKLPGDAVTVPNPMIIVEVSSPSTSLIDEGKKLLAYANLPSLAHYLIIDIKSRRIIHHRRLDATNFATALLSGGTLRLDPPGLAIDLDDLYAEE